MDTLFNAVLFIGGAVICSVLGLIFVRHYVDLAWLRRHHEIASYFFVMIGTLYAVLVAFAIFTVWQGFKEAGTNLEQEANEIGDLSRLSMAMPDPLRSDIRAALMEYLSSVLNDEFPAMEKGIDSQRTWDAIQNLWNVYGTGKPDSLQMQAYFAESLRHLNELSNKRRIRLFTSRGTVPASLWFLLLSGSLVLIAFTYCFAHESVLSQAIMTASLVCVIGLSLFLILSLDSPYSGVAHVNPAPIELELRHVSARK